jgi:hypothetical protein
MIGGSMAGYSLNAKNEYPTKPKMMIAIFITVAKTGRFNESSDIFISIMY